MNIKKNTLIMELPIESYTTCMSRGSSYCTEMGGSSSKATRITREMLEEYAQLTYLNKAEILQIFSLFETLAPVEVAQNLHHRLPAVEILKVLPQLRHNPFCESILRVFSSDNNGLMSFDDLLDLCSVMSENCPTDIKAYWAFKIFDFDNDNQLSLDDLIETVERLNGFKQDGRLRIDRDSAEFVAQMVLQEMDLDQTGSIGHQEFVHTVARMPEFTQTFRFNV